MHEEISQAAEEGMTCADHCIIIGMVPFLRQHVKWVYLHIFWPLDGLCSINNCTLALSSQKGVLTRLNCTCVCVCGGGGGTGVEITYLQSLIGSNCFFTLANLFTMSWLTGQGVLSGESDSPLPVV